MKNISITALSLMSALSMSDLALAQTNSWNLSRDMMINISANPTVPTSPATGSWSFEENMTGVIDPLIKSSYTLLPTYNAPCDNTGGSNPTLNCWQNMTTPLLLPLVAISSSAPIILGSTTLMQGMPNLHPENNSQAIIGWKSPIKGTVKIQGRIAHINPGCGDGVQWRIKKAAPAVSSPLVNLTAWKPIKYPATLLVPSARTFSLSTAVNIGTKIYFVVDKNADHNCDWTTLDVLIDKM